jgi:hypothetical protein
MDDTVMIIGHDGIGFTIEQGRVLRRYCNYTREEAIAEFKDYLNRHEVQQVREAIKQIL